MDRSKNNYNVVKEISKMPDYYSTHENGAWASAFLSSHLMDIWVKIEKNPNPEQQVKFFELMEAKKIIVNALSHTFRLENMERIHEAELIKQHRQIEDLKKENKKLTDTINFE